MPPAIRQDLRLIISGPQPYTAQGALDVADGNLLAAIDPATQPGMGGMASDLYPAVTPTAIVLWRSWITVSILRTANPRTG